MLQYPAMMVPQMVRALLEETTAVLPEAQRVGDPFVGSGTVLTEAMLQGLEFYGRDVNPLAALLCRVKAGPFFPEAAQERADEAIVAARRDRGRAIEVQFPGRDKWFTREAQISLSRIRRAIMNEPSLWARRLLWIAFAETVRLSSNSRSTTFKLHVRPSKEIALRSALPLDIFENVVSANQKRYQSLAEALRARRTVIRGRYSRTARVDLCDTRRSLASEKNSCDIVITSPPYGDNATTVPYGQYSYLPLRWIHLPDIGPEASADALKTTREIDRRSLGGSRRMTPECVASLARRSAALRRILSSLKQEPIDRAGRVASFVRDLDACLDGIEAILKPGGVMVWVLGNRRVGGKMVPTDSILQELLTARGLEPIADIRRRISSKRMAHRNRTAKTMLSEVILVLRKRESPSGGTRRSDMARSHS